MDPFATHLFTLEGRYNTHQPVLCHIRSDSGDRVLEQAQRAGWHSLQIQDQRPLLTEERVEPVLGDILDDERFGAQWLPFFVALETWLGFLADWPTFDSQVLTPDNDYARPTYFPQYRFTGKFPFSRQVWISPSKRAATDHPGIAAIEKDGWLAPTHRFHLGHHLPITPGTPLSRAVYRALSALSEFVDLTPDVFFTFYNFDTTNKDGLNHLCPVTHGDYTYYQIPSAPQDRHSRTKRLTSSPVTTHRYRRLQPGEREDFIRRWRGQYPDCHTWSDDRILHWVAFGA
jgi:hypothetical protein